MRTGKYSVVLMMKALSEAGLEQFGWNGGAKSMKGFCLREWKGEIQVQSTDKSLEEIKEDSLFVKKDKMLENGNKIFALLYFEQEKNK